jgi:hypothetical protein
LHAEYKNQGFLVYFLLDMQRCMCGKKIKGFSVFPSWHATLHVVVNFHLDCLYQTLQITWDQLGHSMPMVAFRGMKTGQGYYPTQLKEALENSISSSHIMEKVGSSVPVLALPEAVHVIVQQQSESHFPLGFSDIFIHGNCGKEELVKGLYDKQLRPEQKPLHLCEMWVLLFTQPGDLVLDRFAGTGTIGVACAKWGRRYLGFELDPAVTAAANTRIRSAYNLALNETPNKIT